MFFSWQHEVGRSEDEGAGSAQQPQLQDYGSHRPPCHDHRPIADSWCLRLQALGCHLGQMSGGIVWNPDPFRMLWMMWDVGLTGIFEFQAYTTVVGRPVRCMGFHSYLLILANLC